MSDRLRLDNRVHLRLAVSFIRALGIAATAAAGALALVPAGADAASPTSCTANTAVSPLARSEGQTELVGDVILFCTGGTPTTLGEPVPTRTLSVFLNTQVTSRVLAFPWDEALLLVDEPGSGLPGAPTAQTGARRRAASARSRATAAGPDSTTARPGTPTSSRAASRGTRSRS